MAATTLEGAVSAIPFRPFSLVMPDGAEVPVRQADDVTHNPNGRTALIMRDAVSSTLVDLQAVGELRFQPPNPGGYSGIR